MKKITVQNIPLSVIKVNDKDYISLTDMLRAKDGDFFFSNWLRNRNTIEFLGMWEQLNNPNFNCAEFDIIKSMAGLNNYRLSAKEWMSKTHAVGIISRPGRYGGTFAHQDIAFEFAMWISPAFKVYLIREFQRLKESEQKLIGWSAKRELAKINYHIHTDAIKQNLIPQKVNSMQSKAIYAEEADVLNVAMFGVTAAEWRKTHPELKGNIRDYASINELICLSNMENINAILIDEGISQSERLIKLNQIAIHQMQVLNNNDDKKLLK